MYADKKVVQKVAADKRLYLFEVEAFLAHVKKSRPDVLESIQTVLDASAHDSGAQGLQFFMAIGFAAGQCYERNRVETVEGVTVKNPFA